MPNEKFIYVESNQIALNEVPYGDIKAGLTDPTTGKPYRGIVLEGVFADLNSTPNNNARIYDIPIYLEHLKELKKQVLSARGVYGELEHPSKYSIDYNNVSHKILDVWYEEDTKLVKGRVILLDTEKGRIASNIVRSGGQLAISARAAGEEIQQQDGTKRAVVKLLRTYDLVSHPGFSSAVLEFKELNESEQFLQQSAQSKNGFSLFIKAKDLSKLNEHYIQYLTISDLSESEVVERRSKCFYEYLMESQNSEQQKDIEMLEDNEPTDEQQKEQQLSDSVQQELGKSTELDESARYQQQSYKKLAKTVFDNSAGFIDMEMSSQGGYVDSYTL